MNFLFRNKIKFLIIFLICLLNVNFVHAESMKIAGQGLFTPTITKPDDLCNVPSGKPTGDYLFKKSDGSVDKEQKDAFNKLGDVGKDDKTLPEKAVTGIMDNASKSMEETLFKMDCSKNSVSFATSFVKIADPVNITSNSLVMKLISVTQYIGLALSVLFIVVYGFLYQFGSMELDPFKFILRVGATILTIYFLPYLMQDLLNINNIIVYNIATLPLGATVGDSAQAGFYGLATLGVGVAGTAVAMIGVGLGSGIFMGILALIAVVLLIKPILQILVWWFARILMVFALAIFGPILVVGMMLPQTTSYAQKWAKMFVGETFSQVFMTLGGFFVASILGQFGQFSSEIGLGIVDRLIFFYALILFLGTLPQIIAKLIDSGGSSALAKQLGGIGNSVALMASAAGSMAAGKYNRDKAKGDGNKVQENNDNALKGLFSGAGSGSDSGHNITTEGVGKLKDSMKASQNSASMSPNMGATMQFGAGAGGETGTGTGANNLPKDVEKDGGNTGVHEQQTQAEGEASPSFAEQNAEGAGTLPQQGEDGVNTQTQGEDHADIPQENTEALEELPQEMLEGLYSGTMDRDSAVTGLADKFMEQGMSSEGAIEKAQKSIAGFEDKTVLSWNAQNAMGQLHAMGALNSDRVRQIAHSDFSQRSPEFRNMNKDDQNKLVNDFIGNSSLRDVGSQSTNQTRMSSLEGGSFNIKGAGGVNISTGSNNAAIKDAKMKESRADGLVNDFKNGAMSTSVSDSEFAQSYVNRREGSAQDTQPQDTNVDTPRTDVEPPSGEDGEHGEKLEEIFTPTETFDDGPHGNEEFTYQDTDTTPTEHDTHEQPKIEPPLGTDVDDSEDGDGFEDDLTPFSADESTPQPKNTRFDGTNKDVELNFDYQEPTVTDTTDGTNTNTDFHNPDSTKHD